MEKYRLYIGHNICSNDLKIQCTFFIVHQVTDPMDDPNSLANE